MTMNSPIDTYRVHAEQRARMAQASFDVDHEQSTMDDQHGGAMAGGYLMLAIGLALAVVVGAAAWCLIRLMLP